MNAAAPAHRERLWVPVGWWAIALAVGVPVAAALGIYLGWWQVLLLVALCIAGIVAALLWYGGVTVVADDEGLRCGEDRIAWDFVGEATALGASATRELLGPRADPRAELVVRPYCRLAVNVDIVDPHDPHPYWLVSTRRPTALAAAVNARAAYASAARREGVAR